MIGPLADGDVYRTDRTRSRSILTKLFLSSPKTFYLQVLVTVLKARRKAKRGVWDDTEWCRSSMEILRNGENVGMEFEVIGLDWLRNLKSPAVIISNHMSTLETFLFPGIILPFLKLTFVVKDSLVTHPIFGPVMSSKNPVVVGRKNAREDFAVVMKQGSERIRAGYSMVIFPQSTRSEVFRPADFNTLGIKLAARAGVPVMPAAVRTDAWGNGKFLKELGPVRTKIPVNIAFGEPFTIHNKGTEEHEKVVSFITAHLRNWGARVEA